MKDNTVIDKKSIEERAERVISNAADFAIDQMLRTITDEESIQLHHGEKIGKSIPSIDEKKLVSTRIAIKKSVVLKLEERGIEILFSSNPDFPENMEQEEWGCYISLINENEIIVA